MGRHVNHLTRVLRAPLLRHQVERFDVPVLLNQGEPDPPGFEQNTEECFHRRDEKPGGGNMEEVLRGRIWGYLTG
ncbi:MAG: hypothetical protein ABWK01_01900 [Infirmifilum sp.]